MLPNQISDLRERLKKVIKEVRSTVFEEEGALLSTADLFTLWFLRVELGLDMRPACKAITNGPYDRSCDAIRIDHGKKTVHIVQTKYHTAESTFGKTATKAETITEFANVCAKVKQSTAEEFNALVDKANPKVRSRLKVARERVLEDGYSIKMHFVTTGTATHYAKWDAEEVLGQFDEKEVSFVFHSIEDVGIVLADYEDHICPAIREAEIPVEYTSNLQVKNILSRSDLQNDIECWVLPVNGRVVGNLYRDNGRALFARNVRGYMGKNTPVNQDMQTTLRHNPEMFIHHNNGVTIACDFVEKKGPEGSQALVVKRPQIINGQQTTRSLNSSMNSENASVLVKVVRLPSRYEEDPKRYYDAVGAIVRATNSQTPVTSSDLVSNDRKQLAIDDAMKQTRQRFIYLRKRETMAESDKRFGPGKRDRYIKKLDLAVAVASCEFDQHTVRSGREKLFEGDLYKRVFPNTKPLYYLTRYFCWKAVKRVSSARTLYGYARAMVVNYVWEALKPLMGEDDLKRETFVDKCFNKDARLSRAIDKLAKTAFTEAIKFYSKNSGRGDDKIDISQFFRNKKGRNQQFKKHRRYWSLTSRKNFKEGTTVLRKILKDSSGGSAGITRA